jgi:hypothetical protein
MLPHEEYLLVSSGCCVGPARVSTSSCSIPSAKKRPGEEGTHTRAVAHDVLPQFPQLLLWLGIFRAVDTKVVVRDYVQSSVARVLLRQV